MTSKKGFTLIELLIVIAIIGILASALLVSLGGARQAARDARRISDLRQVQTALEVYFNATGCYPGGAVGVGACGAANPATWAELAASLGVTIANDPVNTGTYVYGVDDPNQSYAIGATLEITNNAVLSNDLDGVQQPTVNGAGGQYIDCTDPTYCVSL